MISREEFKSRGLPVVFYDILEEDIANTNDWIANDPIAREADWAETHRESQEKSQGRRRMEDQRQSRINLFNSFENINSDLVILRNEDPAVVKRLAQESNKAFSLILSRPDCQLCHSLVLQLIENHERFKGSIFNIIDVSLPENRWYQQWLYSGAVPTTCVFSPSSELRAIIPGRVERSIQCIEYSIAGRTQCADNFLNRQIADRDHMPMLSAMFWGKHNLEAGRDISNLIGEWLPTAQYPFPFYLKYRNEKQQGRHERARYWANRLVSIVGSDQFFVRVYSDLSAQARSFVNPNYATDGAVLSVTKELDLGEFGFRESTPFSLTVSNTGMSTLSILHTEIGCSCLRMLSDRQQTIEPGESKVLDFTFTADVRGDIMREIVFVSNGINPVQIVLITAQVR